MAEAEVQTVDVALNIGENGAPDRAEVRVTIVTTGSTGSTRSRGFRLPEVDLPPGTIVSDALSAQKQARHATADILDKVAASLRKD